MLSNYTNNLLNLKWVKIKKIKHTDLCVEVHVETNPKDYICFHDYRTQPIKDLPIQFNNVKIFYRNGDMYVLVVRNSLNLMTFFLDIKELQIDNLIIGLKMLVHVTTKLKF